MTLYVETSAILAWLFGDPQGKTAKRPIDAADRVASSVVTGLEAERAVVRAEATGLVTPAEAQRLRGLLVRTFRQWSLLGIDAAVLRRAGERFPVEPVRTLDAIHLASAIELLAPCPDLGVLSFGARIRNNLEPLGLTARAR